MSTLKARLEADRTRALKDRDELVLNTLRMTLTAVKNAEVAGNKSRDLSDAEVLKIIAKQAKQRAEAAEAFEAGGRTEQAARERAEGEVLAGYLPKQLDEAEVTAIIDEVFVAEGFSGPADMGKAMKAVQAKIAGRADGKVVAGLVKARLTG